jgi:hypothetical protein
MGQVSIRRSGGVGDEERRMSDEPEIIKPGVELINEYKLPGKLVPIRKVVTADPIVIIPYASLFKFFY